MEYWQQFVSKFFSPDGKFVLHLATTAEGRIKQFTTPFATLARYWWTYFESGVQNLQVKMESAKQTPLANDCHYVAFERCQFVFWYGNGVQVSEIYTSQVEKTDTNYQR